MGESRFNESHATRLPKRRCAVFFLNLITATGASFCFVSVKFKSRQNKKNETAAPKKQKSITIMSTVRCLPAAFFTSFFFCVCGTGERDL
jgi:hypothetical protein